MHTNPPPRRIEPPYCPPPPETLRVLLHDDHLIAVDKPSGLLSVPGRGPLKTVCAASLLTAQFGPVHVVHRLDMDTSGIMVFARTPAAHRALSAQFEARITAKTYEAIITGSPATDSGHITLPIARFSLQRPLRHVAPDGQEAITDWQVIERLIGKTRVRLTPQTGRSHQLRLHMKEIGHPILGDPFYGDPNLAPRLMLHAARLVLRHPANDAQLELTARVPF